MATVKQIIEKAYTKVNGEFESLAESSDDFKTYLNVLNQGMEAWRNTPYTKWQTLFNPAYDLTEVVEVGKFEYDVPAAYDEIVANSPFDSVYFMDGETVVARFRMTDQALFQSSTATDICALFGETLYLKTVPEKIVGLTIRVPIYELPPVYTSGAQTVKIDSVSWLVSWMAAFICDASPVPFIARNADKYTKQAEIFMKGMKANNRHRQHLSIKKASQDLNDWKFGSLSQAINAGVGASGADLNAIDGGEI